ncbi:hypothetical protein FQZ97_1076540 [compost metagenome]
MTEQGGQAIDAEQRHFALDQPELAQTFDTSEAGGWRKMRLFGQGLVAQGRIVLQKVEQAEVGLVDDDLFHI